MTETAPLRALALVCSLKPSPAPSSSELMARQVLEQLAKHGVTGDVVRVVDHDVKPGVEVDRGAGDAWPGIRAETRAAVAPLESLSEERLVDLLQNVSE